MMPDMIVQPQVTQKLPARNSSASKTTKVAMQKAASQGDSPVQAASSGSSPSQQKAPLEKSTEQPTQFFDLLMAQIEAPTEAVVLPVLAPESINTDDAASISPNFQSAPFSPQPLTTQNTQGVVSQSLISSSVQTPKVAAEMPVLTPEPVQVTSEAVQPHTITPPVAPQAQPQLPAASLQETPASPSNPEQQAKTAITEPNIAHTVATSTVKDIAQTSGIVSEMSPETPRKTHEPVLNTQPDVASANEKATLAQILATRITSKANARQMHNAPQHGAPVETVSQVTQTVSADPMTLLQGSQAGVTVAQQDTAASVTLPVQTTAAQTASEAAASLRFLANQVAEGVRSAVGSDRTMTISLNPPELGRVYIHMQEDNGAVDAVLKVENPVTRSDIEQSLPSIVRSLEQSGIQIRRMDVLPSDPVPQEGSFARHYDMQGGTPNQRDSQNNASSQTDSPAGNSWQDVQPAVVSAAPISIVSDSSINIYV